MLQLLSRQSKPTILLAAFALLAFIGFLDVLTGFELSFSVFYLLPIFLVTWLFGPRLGFFFSALGPSVSYLSDLLAGAQYSHSLVPFWNLLVRFIFYLITTLLLSDLKDYLAKIEFLARTDSLTQVANLRHFYSLAEQEIARAARYGGPFTVAYMDLDNFKLINDRYGHNTGDQLLSLVAQTIQAELRRTDTVARVGGDEFAILLPQTAGDTAALVITRLQQRLAETLAERQWPVGLSIGVVTYLSPPASTDAMMQAADLQMYAAKNKGKGQASYDVHGHTAQGGPA